MSIIISESDEFVCSRLQQLKMAYEQSSSVQATYQQGIGFLNQAKSMSGFWSSLQVAKLESFLSELQLAAGNISTVQIAKQHSESSLRRVENARVGTSDLLELVVTAALQNAVAHKALGDYDAAFRTIEYWKAQTSKSLSATAIDHIPLIRQEALMRQSGDVFVKLANDARNYQIQKPVDYFTTLKRVFEFVMNRRELSLAKKIEYPLKQAYRAARHRLPTISKVSFVKNLGQHLLLQGEFETASLWLTKALVASTQLGLSGQCRQISQLLNSSPNEVHLQTFSVG